MFPRLNSGDEQRKRRSRITFIAALILLLIIWTVKLFPPHHSNLTEYFHSIASSNLTLTGNDKSPASSLEQSAGGHFNASSSNKAAVIIETRFRTNLVPLILHFSSVLGPTWPILIYTSAESVGMFASSAALKRYLHSGLIELRLLPQETLFSNSISVTTFLTQTWIWDNLAPAEHILMFQSDSMLCGNAARSVDDFFQYDLIGAPIKEELGVGYNGGLSLRKRSSILRVLNRFNWVEAEAQTAGDRFEDQWYFARMKEIQQKESVAGILKTKEGAINLPSMEIARTFAVESIDYPHPLGLHQPGRWLKKQSDMMLRLDDWCPEYKLCSKEHVQDIPS